MAARDDDDRSRRPRRGARQETLFRGSITEEKHPEVTPQNPSDFPKKLRTETAGENLPRKVKRVVEEFDRDIGGEYQRREDPTAPPPIEEKR